MAIPFDAILCVLNMVTKDRRRKGHRKEFIDKRQPLWATDIDKQKDLLHYRALAAKKYPCREVVERASKNWSCGVHSR